MAILPHNIIFKSYRVKQFKRITGHLPGAVEKACQIVQEEAKRNVGQSGGQHPQIVTGALKDGIRYNIWKGAMVIRGYVGITKELFYGRMLEFGTIHIPAYPWLFPAMKAKEKEVQKLLKGR